MEERMGNFEGLNDEEEEEDEGEGWGMAFFSSFCLKIKLTGDGGRLSWFSESDRTSRMETRGNPEGRVSSSPASSMAFHFLTSEECLPDRHGGSGSCLLHCRHRVHAGSTGVQLALHHQRIQEETAEANQARKSDWFSESPSTVRSASWSLRVATERDLSPSRRCWSNTASCRETCRKTASPTKIARWSTWRSLRDNIPALRLFENTN